MARLDITPFTLDLLPLVQDFYCGNLDYQREVADWIRGDSPYGVRDALANRKQQTVVWLYSAPEYGIVGYGSLCRSNWTSSKGGPRDMPISLIPSLGIRAEHHGCPKDAPKSERFSSQIIRHLEREACQYSATDRLPFLGLFVHPENIAGKALYEREHFEYYHQTYTDQDSGVTYLGMILKLATRETQQEQTTVIQTGDDSLPQPDIPPVTSHSLTFEQAVSAVLNAPPLPEQQAKKAARQARTKRQKKDTKPKPGRP